MKINSTLKSLNNTVLSAPTRYNNKFSKRSFATESDDVVVIGGGPGGYVGAIRAAQLGFKVLSFENERKNVFFLIKKNASPKITGDLC